MDLSVHKRLHFELVNDENRKEVEGLTVFSEQAGFIESVNECLQEADELELWRPVGIYDSDTLIGFAMYGYFPEPTPGQLWLDRLLIDKKYQGKGYGKQAVFSYWTDCTQSIKAILYITLCLETGHGYGLTKAFAEFAAIRLEFCVQKGEGERCPQQADGRQCECVYWLAAFVY